MQGLLPESGEVVGGKYRIVRMLGSGGMGAVFEAEHTLTRKRVAVKWVRPELLLRSDGLERLMREAQASARIRHPNVVDVYDVGREGDAFFLVMECLEGEPLSALLERGQTPLSEVIALLLPAMRGVAEAHRCSVIHRDIKPDNIFLAKQTDQAKPVPKVLDFGIAKILDEDSAGLTGTGIALGTPLYMSYEQLSGAKHADARSDVYSFGVILYEAATGRPPFEANSFSELVIKVATTEAPEPKAVKPELPTALSRLIQWAMMRDRDQRIQTLDELVAELEPFATRSSYDAQLTQSVSTLSSRHPAALARPSERASAEAAAHVRGQAVTVAKPALGRSVAIGVVLLALLGFGTWAFFGARSSAIGLAVSAATAAPASNAPSLEAAKPKAPSTATTIGADAVAAPPTNSSATGLLPAAAPPALGVAGARSKDSSATTARRSAEKGHGQHLRLERGAAPASASPSAASGAHPVVEIRSAAIAQPAPVVVPAPTQPPPARAASGNPAPSPARPKLRSGAPLDTNEF